MRKQLRIVWFTGWLFPAALALLFFGRWIKEIVIPTLKGGSFDQLYDQHHVQYLDTTMLCIAIAFVWATLVVLRWANVCVNTDRRTA